jgi:hypothetical protein
MSYFGQKDYYLEVAAGRVPGKSPVNKFGRAFDGVQLTPTDIWDRADAASTQQIWVAPTTARVHNIASTSTNDTSGGTGARTIRVYGLTSWSADEASEDVIMNGTSNVATSNAYVIIHRMKVLTYGASGPNLGTITATAASDGTVTAQINYDATNAIGQGQTQMAIYGVPSTKCAYITNYYFSLPELAATPSTAIDVQTTLLINEDPTAQLGGFLVKHTKGLVNTGTSDAPHDFKPYNKVTGPAIIKLQAESTSADTDVSAGFDLILEDV